MGLPGREGGLKRRRKKKERKCNKILERRKQNRSHFLFSFLFSFDLGFFFFLRFSPLHLPFSNHRRLLLPPPARTIEARGEALPTPAMEGSGGGGAEQGIDFAAVVAAAVAPPPAAQAAAATTPTAAAERPQRSLFTRKQPKAFNLPVKRGCSTRIKKTPAALRGKEEKRRKERREEGSDRKKKTDPQKKTLKPIKTVPRQATAIPLGRKTIGVTHYRRTGRYEAHIWISGRDAEAFELESAAAANKEKEEEEEGKEKEKGQASSSSSSSPKAKPKEKKGPKRGGDAAEEKKKKRRKSGYQLHLVRLMKFFF